MTEDYRELVLFDPDYRFFVERGEPSEKRIDFVWTLLEESGNDPKSIWRFIKGIHRSENVAFAIIFGGAANSLLNSSEIMDVDILVVTRDKEFDCQWNELRGAETRYFLLSDIENYLKGHGRLFPYRRSREYNVFAGIFAKGFVSLKFSKELEKIVRAVRKNFQRIRIRALSQIVEHDCAKRMKKRIGHRTGGSPVTCHKKDPISFYGVPLSLEEARLAIEASIRHQNIQPREGPRITREILRKIRKEGNRTNGAFSIEWR